MKKMLRVGFLMAAVMLLLGCANEKSDLSPCESMLKKRPDLVAKYKQIECLNDSSLFYTRKVFPMGVLFFARVEGDSFRTISEADYGQRQFYASLAVTVKVKKSMRGPMAKFFNNQPAEKYSAKRKYYRTLEHFPIYREICIMEGLATEETFDSIFDNVNSFVMDMEWMESVHLDTYWAELFKKDSMHLYIQGVAPTGGMDLYSLNPLEPYKPLYTFIHEDYEGNPIRGYYAKEVQVTDSSFYAKYESGDWILYNHVRDTVLFHIQDTTGNYVVEHYKNNGDTVLHKKGNPQYYMDRTHHVHYHAPELWGDPDSDTKTDDDEDDPFF